MYKATDLTFSNKVAFGISRSTDTQITFISPSDGKVCISFGIHGVNDEDDPAQFTNIQLEQGTTNDV